MCSSGREVFPHLISGGDPLKMVYPGRLSERWGEPCLISQPQKAVCPSGISGALPGEGSGVPQHKCEGHYAKIAVRRMEMVGHSLESMSWIDASDW